MMNYNTEIIKKFIIYKFPQFENFLSEVNIEWCEEYNGVDFYIGRWKISNLSYNLNKIVIYSNSIQNILRENELILSLNNINNEVSSLNELDSFIRNIKFRKIIEK